MSKRVELLSPAGNMDGFRGALNAGCDAVYLGGPAFGARAYAENFTEEELIGVIRTAHLHGVRVYMTVNILTRQEELGDCVEMVSRLYEQGLDGVIVQDLGVLSALGKACPGLLLHASTQLSCTLPESVRYLKRLGVSRIVPARELSLEEVRQIKAEGVEVESFIHGAMCYCYSGRCLMSSFLGGRSGNRGRCAGTCRLPYEILDAQQMPALKGKENFVQQKVSRAYLNGTENGRTESRERRQSRGRRSAREEMGTGTYPLSMRDMCTLQILPELIDAGIDSFKIEGRMKKPEYAAGVTAFYRKYIDRFYAWDQAGRPGRWKVEPEDLRQLRSLYLREELSTGYYQERNGRDMITLTRPGYAGADDALLARLHQQYVEPRPQVPVQGKAIVKAGQPAVLEIRTQNGQSRAAASSQQLVSKAVNRPLTREDIARCLRKTGDSDFCLADLEVETDGQSFFPVSALNALRRNALDQLGMVILDHSETAGRDRAGRRTARIPDQVRAQTAEVEYIRSDLRSVSSSTIQDHPQAQPSSAQSGLQVRLSSIGSHPRVLTIVSASEQLQTVQGTGVDTIILDGPLADLVAEGRMPDFGKSGAREADSRGVDDRRGKAAFFPTEEKSAVAYYAALPYIFRESDRGWMEHIVQRVSEDPRHQITGFLCRTIEEIEFLREKDYDGHIIADSSVYRWNQEADALIARDCDQTVLPLELSGRELLETYQSTLPRQVLQVYGYLPMMVTANCVRKTAGACRHQEEGYWYLRDRKGVLFPVRTCCRHCHNIIYNSVPLSLHHAMDDEIVRKAGGILLAFTRENAEETRQILERFGLPGSAGMAHSAAHTAREASVYTTGHYRKGAL